MKNKTKKITLIIILFITSILLSYSTTYGKVTDSGWGDGVVTNEQGVTYDESESVDYGDPEIIGSESPDETSSDGKNSIYVTAEVPGANCVVATKEGKEGLYKCDVERGFGAIMNIMGNMIKYFTFISGLLAVLTIVVGGIAYSMGGADDSLKTKSKEFIQKSLMGLIILLLSGTILYAVAPWVYN